MSIYKSSSLAMLPTAYKDGKLYSIRPTDGSGDFTFSRGSNLAATRVDVNGLIEKGRENLLLQSNQFDTTWGPSSSISVTGGQSGYDGTNDAWLLKRSDASARYINQNITLGSSVYTYSVYAKPESENWMYFWSYNGSGSVNAYFDLQNGVVGNTSGLIDATIVDAGNGYYRCSITYNNNVASVRIYPAVANGSITGGIVGAGIYIQDSQLESSLVATSVIETGATTAQSGILEDLPRLDYSGGASCPSLLLEPQRTNVVTNSEYLNGWNTIQAITIEANTNETLSPEGKYNAYKTTAIGGGTQRIYDVVVVSAGSITMSMYVKSGTEDQIRLLTTANTFDITFDLTNQTKNEDVGTGTIEPVGNGWYRISATGTSVGGTEVPQVRHLGTAGSSEYQYWYGIQLEAGSYPTSYIPTMGSAVTRSADSCNKTGISDLIGQTEGVAFCEVNMSSKTLSSSWAFSLNDGTTSNYIGLRRSGGNELFVHINVGGTTTALIGTGITTGTHKIGIAYANNDISVYVDGVNVGIDTSAVPATSVIEIGDLVSNRYFDDSIKQFLLFKTRLTNTELASLTTL